MMGNSKAFKLGLEEGMYAPFCWGASIGVFRRSVLYIDE